MATNTEWPVTTALYQAEGKPSLDKKATFSGDHRCGNCGCLTESAPAADVLTSRFGSWDDIAVNPDGRRWLCRACAWTYRAVALRRGMFLISRTPSVESLTLTQLHAILSAPLSLDVALIIPVNGKKIVAPAAQWGKIATDCGVIGWSSRHLRVLRAGQELIEMGFTKHDLTRDGPSFLVLRHHPELLNQASRLWAQFSPARADKVLLPFFLKILKAVPHD